MLEEVADNYDLPRVRAFSQWGSWQRTHPDVASGLKRGFTFYFHEPGCAFRDPDDRSRQLLVAASPNDDVSDTHWYRPDFDQALVREAEAAGAIFRDLTKIDRIRHEGNRSILEGALTLFGIVRLLNLLERTSPGPEREAGWIQNRDLWLADLTSGMFEPLTSHPGLESSPAWSPEGNRIAYHSNQGGVISPFVKYLETGQFFLVLEPASTRPQTLTYLLDWIDALNK